MKPEERVDVKQLEETLWQFVDIYEVGGPDELSEFVLEELKEITESTDILILYAIGQNLLRRGRVDTALEIYEKSLDSIDDVWDRTEAGKDFITYNIFCQIGAAYLNKNDFPKMETYLDKALDIRPDTFIPYITKLKRFASSNDISDYNKFKEIKDKMEKMGLKGYEKKYFEDTCKIIENRFQNMCVGVQQRRVCG